MLKRRGRIKIKTWWLVVALAPLLFLDATLLRLDHIRMTELRDSVMTADEEGDDEKLATSLTDLKEFVFSHIVINVIEENGEQRITFGTGPFYLEHKYLKDANAALEEAEKNMASDANPNGNIYGKAGETCRALAYQNGWSWNSAEYINCMISEIQKYPAADDLESQLIAKLPSTELYRRNYASPIWAPTLAGFMILITLILIVVIFIKMVIFIGLWLSLFFV